MLSLCRAKNSVFFWAWHQGPKEHTVCGLFRGRVGPMLVHVGGQWWALVGPKSGAP